MVIGSDAVRCAHRILPRYADLATPVRPPAVAGVAPDPDDDVVIGTALAARADLIVTGDRGLLSVGEHRGVRVVGVAQALALIEQTTNRSG